MFGNFLKSIFKRERWETICFTTDPVEYGRIKGKLINGNIMSKTKITGGGYNARDRAWGGLESRQYEIRVKASDAHKANEAVHSR